MSAYLHLQDFKNGKSNAEKCLGSFPQGSPEWFKFMEYYLLLAIHTENYINALAVFNRATKQSRFTKLMSEEKERWNLYEAYIYYIVENQEDQNPILRQQMKRVFRVKKFLNSPLLYPRHQRMFIILMLIVQILFLIERRSFSEITERIDRLKSYANRQLRKEEYLRIRAFIRLLQALSKADYKARNLSNIEKNLNILKGQQFYYRGLLTELEVIPYERLWVMILKKMN